MGQAIGGTIAFAVGIAISPFPIIAVVLMLLSQNARTNSLAFAAGWFFSIAGASAILIATSDGIGTDDSDGGSARWVSIVRLALGALLLWAALRKWQKRPKAGEPTVLPKWFTSIESTTAGKSLLLGVVLFVNPKCLLLVMAAGLVIAGAPISPVGEVVAGVVFVVLATSTVMVPVTLHRVFGSRAQPTLEALKVWLEANNTTIMALLLLVFGVVLIGSGISGF